MKEVKNLEARAKEYLRDNSCNHEFCEGRITLTEIVVGFYKPQVKEMKEVKNLEARAKEYLQTYGMEDDVIKELTWADDLTMTKLMSDFHKQEIQNLLPSDEDRETKQDFYSQQIQFSPTDHEFNYYMGFTDAWNAFKSIIESKLK